jgi:hypothetical protein
MNKVSTLKKKPVSLPSFKALKDVDIPVKMKPESAFNDLVLTTRDGAVQWLEANIRKARDEGVFMTDEILTSALARELLDRNDKNRHASKTIIDEMVTSMRAEIGPKGFDSMNGEAIKISICGLLNDGQHRCHAKLESGVDFRTRFIFGLPRESRLTIDQGKSRRAADYVTMQGMESGTKVSSVALLYYYWQLLGAVKRPGGSSTVAYRPGPSRMAEFVKEHYDQIKRSVDSVPKEGANALGGFALIGFAHLLFAEKDFGAATNFVERLVKGVDLSEKSPIRVCRERLINGTRLRRHERWELILRAWNAWREDREVTQFTVRGHKPKISD